MSLSDLKKNSTQSKTRHCNVDEFINDAERYAQGYSNVVSITGQPIHPAQAVNPAQAINPAQAVNKIKSKQPYRKATFTLSEQCIEALTSLSQDSGRSKSHLVRMLISQLADSSKDNVSAAR